MGKPFIPSRRDVLKSSGALVVSFSFGGPAREALAEDAVAPKPVALTALDSFLAIDSAGAVTIYSGKVDLGTGVRTALTQDRRRRARCAADQGHDRARRHGADTRPGTDIRQPRHPDRRRADPQCLRLGEEHAH